MAANFILRLAIIEKTPSGEERAVRNTALAFTPKVNTGHLSCLRTFAKCGALPRSPIPGPHTVSKRLFSIVSSRGLILAPYNFAKVCLQL